MTIKALWSMLLNGIRQITLFPEDDYARFVPKDAVEISRKAWEMTGRVFTDTMNGVGARVHARG